MHPAEKFVPNDYRLESHLRESLRNGALRPGDPVPPESSLCQQFGVSRTTVRQALSRENGKVAPPLHKMIHKIAVEFNLKEIDLQILAWALKAPSMCGEEMLTRCMK